jgi:hypothetical protein
MRRHYARQTEEDVEGDMTHLEVLSQHTLRWSEETTKIIDQSSRAPAAIRIVILQNSSLGR